MNSHLTVTSYNPKFSALISINSPKNLLTNWQVDKLEKMAAHIGDNKSIIQLNFSNVKGNNDAYNFSHLAKLLKRNKPNYFKGDKIVLKNYIEPFEYAKRTLKILEHKFNKL